MLLQSATEGFSVLVWHGFDYTARALGRMECDHDYVEDAEMRRYQASYWGGHLILLSRILLSLYIGTFT